MLSRYLFVLASFASTVACSTVAAQGSAKPAAPKRGAPLAAAVHYSVAPTGNEARYRVREQLVGFDLPNDAIGVTHDIAGTLVVDGAGAVVADSSRITVTLTALKSDKDRRDGFLQRRVLETDKFPTVELAPQAFHGLAGKLPSAPTAFELVSSLTIRGVARPTTWKVTAHSEGADIVGTATTAFTFKDINLEQPRVPVVLSVADTIKLEYDFRFTPAKKP